MKNYSIHITGQGPACTGDAQDIDIIISRVMTELNANGSVEHASVIVDGRRLQLVGEPVAHPKGEDTKPAKKPRGKTAKPEEGRAEGDAADASNPEETAPPEV